MTELLRTLNQFEIFIKNLNSSTLGFVPTMGNLHEGHMTLVKESLHNNETTVVSIFVNPKQFGPNEDYKKYPRSLGDDLKKLKKIHESSEFQDQKLVVFAPITTDEVFPTGFATTISVSGLSDKLCGLARPGHFAGVTTVVYRLFSLVRPQKAYFGQKDYQQYLVIKQMAEDLKLGIQLIPMPIIRDEDGLALSSRNQYLSTDERKTALLLPQTLDQLRKIIKEEMWEKAYLKVKTKIANILESNKTNINCNWDYLEILDALKLTDPDDESHTVVIAGALTVGKTRLIDNRIVEIRNV